MSNEQKEKESKEARPTRNKIRAQDKDRNEEIKKPPQKTGKS